MAVDVLMPVWLVGWWRTKPACGCFPISGAEGGPADFGVINTELVGERLPGAGANAGAPGIGCM